MDFRPSRHIKSKISKTKIYEKNKITALYSIDIQFNRSKCLTIIYVTLNLKNMQHK